MGRHASRAPRQVGSGPRLVRVASCPPGRSRAWAGSQMAFSPVKGRDGERDGAKTCTEVAGEIGETDPLKAIEDTLGRGPLRRDHRLDALARRLGG
jgi:hypothetical protein